MRRRVNFFEKTKLGLLQGLMVMGWLIIILNRKRTAMVFWAWENPAFLFTKLALSGSVIDR